MGQIREERKYQNAAPDYYGRQELEKSLSSSSAKEFYQSGSQKKQRGCSQYYLIQIKF
jgi:hypothetical protein